MRLLAQDVVDYFGGPETFLVLESRRDDLEGARRFVQTNRVVCVSLALLASFGKINAKRTVRLTIIRDLHRLWIEFFR